MNTKKTVLKNAQKLGREEQKAITGGAAAAKRCCEWDFETGACTLYTCDRCQCP
ncbi:hypothetical protein ODZ84_16470 [Chryseobacterium fluminis]|uniref:hypothetical protein n=1 Tax=Chryseobacterium fluminis TaxID=2983606 RepID=UPI0022546FB3|nr:hypothetical protein [Chryseobacterium sp. MMS21-Ot14]UZT96803.1 hypothetical protein ODZ84_16470 [Chryseobacterium sp. MMS21-Ot14]